MASSWIVEAVDVFEDRHLSLPAGFPVIAPEQFRLDGFEEGFDGGIIIAIAFARHGYFEGKRSLNPP